MHMCISFHFLPVGPFKSHTLDLSKCSMKELRVWAEFILSIGLESDHLAIANRGLLETFLADIFF